MKKFLIVVLLLTCSLTACSKDDATNFETEDGFYAEYAVKNGDIVLDEKMDNDGTVDKEDKIIWQKIKSIVPKKYMNMISKYEVVTDGRDGSLASVYLNDDNITWTISVDLDDTLDEENQEFLPESIKTLIHEMSHIISLNSTQMGGDENDDSFYTVQEGMLKKDAYLSVFYNKFWINHIDEHKKYSEEKNTNVDNEDSFYNKYKDEFVSDYAATNPVEDFAESFAYFVINDKPIDENIKSKKLLFFYDYPEFIKMRDDIRNNIDLDNIY